MKLLLLSIAALLAGTCYAQKADYQALVASPCNAISHQYDDIHYINSYNTAVIIPDTLYLADRVNQADVVFYKTLSKTATDYFISLNTTSPTADIDRKGVIIVLSNGKRINKPMAPVKQTVETINDEAVFAVRSYIKLTPQDIAILKSSAIREFELYTDQKVVAYPDIIFKMFLCLLDKK